MVGAKALLMDRPIRNEAEASSNKASCAARVTAVYAICHFVVDLACVSTLLGWASAWFSAWAPSFSALLIITYDMAAFCLQLPVGAILDALGRRVSRCAALLSFALVAAGVACGWVSGAPLCLASVALVVLGNALFHSVGGVEVLGESKGRMAPAGEFICTGALGLFVGGLSGFNGWAGTPALMLLLLAACAALVVVGTGELSREAGALALASSGRDWLAIVLLALTVSLRSYVGMTMAFPWKSSMSLAVAAVLAVVVGKAVGGRVADAMGARAASLVSLGGAAVLFLPSWGSVPAGLVATFLFNFTMAITLCSLAHILPRAKGTAFGIASFSLAVGALPALMGVQAESGLCLCVLSLVSLALLESALAVMGRPAGQAPRKGAAAVLRPGKAKRHVGTGRDG